jgi:hypothetical protein
VYAEAGAGGASRATTGRRSTRKKSTGRPPRKTTGKKVARRR